MEKVCHGPKSKSMEAWRARDRIKMCARRATVILTLTILARDDDATIQSRSCKYEATRTLEKHEKLPQTEPRLKRLNTTTQRHNLKIITWSLLSQ